MNTLDSNHYQNFNVAIYATVHQVLKMRDHKWLRESFDQISRFVKVGKIYLETHRDTVIADEDTYRYAQEFFKSRGLQVSGGITITISEKNHYETFCYTNPRHRQNLIDIVSYTARMNDELILDDFFFTNCKCASCIQAKGDRSWSQFRLELMTQAARELVLEPARAVNPKINVIIKYPNWYEHFHGLGFNLETQPNLFDQIYTGNETRDPFNDKQHLQQYQGFSIFRYFENLKPGRNAGGWVDTGGMYCLDRYAEQLWLTLFAKAPEVTLFNYMELQRGILESDRASWQGQGTSFDFDALTAPVREADGSISPQVTVALAAGAAFEQVDRFLDQLGVPLGVPCYRPFHSSGEMFLHSYLGMLGIPINLVSEFPSDASTILLTESAKFDSQIVEKIKAQLSVGKRVVITSGLLRALQDRGIRDIVELETSDRKAIVQKFMMDFTRVFSSSQPMIIPQIAYHTNDTWEEISCQSEVTGYPLFLFNKYNGGVLYVLTIPDNFGDLYHLPQEVLTRIKEVLMSDIPVRVESPSQVALFVYDNDTFIVESFLPEFSAIRAVTDGRYKAIQDLLTGEVINSEERLDRHGNSTGQHVYPLSIKPHSFRVFKGCSDM